MSRNPLARLTVLTVASGLVMGMASPTAQATPSSAITNSSAMAAVVGLVTRIPAEIQGGGLYTESSVNLDKARARASALYPGYLADTFLRTSIEEYGELYAGLDAAAEYPPNSRPTSDRVQGGQDGPLGPIGTIRADTPDAKRATGIATGASTATDASELLSFEASTARSRSQVADDGTVMTEALATLSGVRLAEVVTIGNIETRAMVTTAVGQEPEITLATNVERVAVAGVPAVLDQHGLQIADRTVVSSADVDRFNETVAALADAGITIEAMPTNLVDDVGRGAVAGAALRFRYEAKKNETVAGVLDSNPMYQVVPLPKELGYDEEFLLAQVRASSLSRPTDGLGFGLDLGLSEPGLGDASSIGPDDVSHGSASRSSPPAGSGTTALGTATEPSPQVAAPASSTDADPGATTLEPFALTGSPTPTSNHVAGFYRLLLLIALAGAVVPSLLRRATNAS